MYHGPMYPYSLLKKRVDILQEWPELGGGITGVAGPQPSSSIEQPAVASATASEARHATGQQARHRDSNAIPTKPAKAEATGRTPAKTSSSSPDQRHPTTPSPGNAHPHSPETPVSGQTTAGASPAGTPPSAVHSPHQIPHATHKHRRDASASSSDWTQGTAHQAESQQHQQQQCMSQLPVASSSNVQQDPVVQLVSRRSSGRVPPPGFSGPVAAPCASAAVSGGARSKVHVFSSFALFQASGSCSLCFVMLECSESCALGEGPHMPETAQGGADTAAIACTW